VLANSTLQPSPSLHAYVLTLARVEESSRNVTSAHLATDNAAVRIKQFSKGVIAEILAEVLDVDIGELLGPVAYLINTFFT
jgi:hypothetical protein